MSYLSDGPCPHGMDPKVCGCDLKCWKCGTEGTIHADDGYGAAWWCGPCRDRSWGWDVDGGVP